MRGGTRKLGKFAGGTRILGEILRGGTRKFPLPNYMVIYQICDPSQAQLSGGTDVPFSPPLDFFQRVLTPTLAKMGAR